MPMEYLLVHCSEKRRVVLDGTAQGQTGDLLELAAGSYTVTLDPKTGCRPPRHEVVLANTTVLKPCEVTFDVA